MPLRSVMWQNMSRPGVEEMTAFPHKHAAALSHVADYVKAWSGRDDSFSAPDGGNLATVTPLRQECDRERLNEDLRTTTTPF